MIGDQHRVELDAAPGRSARATRPAAFTGSERPVHLTLA
jgi:hypothetical protein